jgi:hypothetical protein
MTKVAGYYSRQTRPRSVTVMIWGVLLLGIANGWRAIGLSQQGSLLLALDASLNPWLGMGLAIFWSILFFIAAFALWQRRSRTRIVIPGLLLVHGLYQIGLVLLFGRSIASRNAWPVIGLLFVSVALFSIWALNRPSIRWYFK